MKVNSSLPRFTLTFAEAIAMPAEIHSYPELQQTEVVSVNDLLMQSFFSPEG
jgi:hypothetical protein